MKKNYHKQAGSSLLEVLIAAVVVGVGLLGIATMQMQAIRSSTDAQYRAIATDLAWTMADRIRANLGGDDSYSNVTANCNAHVPKCAMIPTDSNAVSVTSCTTEQIAAYDIKSVLCTKNGAAELPGGTLSISSCSDTNPTDSDPCSPGSAFTITATWKTRNYIDDTGTKEDKVVLEIMPGTEREGRL